MWNFFNKKEKKENNNYLFDALTIHNKALKLEIIDEYGNLTSNATGFIFNDKGKLFLYTCWHVVSGMNMHELNLSNLDKVLDKINRRKQLKINYLVPGMIINGHLQVPHEKSILIDLYDEEGKPNWEQDFACVDKIEFEQLPFNLPFLHDVIRIDLTSFVDEISSQSIIELDDILEITPFNFNLGHELIIIGFPNGFSAAESEPLSVCLKRNIASRNLAKRQMEFLIDSDCAPAMSGSPVFMGCEGKYYLIGMYTGNIYTNPREKDNGKRLHTSLGSCCILTPHLLGEIEYKFSNCSQQRLKSKDELNTVYSQLKTCGHEISKIRSEVLGI